MASTCADCGLSFTGTRRPVRSITGRQICAECDAGISAVAAGVVGSPAQPVAGAIATEGWFRRLRFGRRTT